MNLYRIDVIDTSGGRPRAVATVSDFLGPCLFRSAAMANQRASAEAKQYNANAYITRIRGAGHCQTIRYADPTGAIHNAS
jgi:hypothetical protein